MWKKEASRKQLNVKDIHDSVQSFNDAHTCVVLLTDASSGSLVNFTVINHGIDDPGRGEEFVDETFIPLACVIQCIEFFGFTVYDRVSSANMMLTT